MRRRWLLLAATLACQAKPHSAPDQVAQAAARRMPSDSMITLSPSDTGDRCGFIPTQANPDPLALVRELMARDGHGDFLETQAWLDSAYLCPLHLPGSDAYQLTTASAVRPLIIEGAFARVPVQYVVIGASSYEVPDSVTRAHGVMEGFRPLLAEVETDTVLLVRTIYGWRIVQPSPPERLDARTALGTRNYWAGARAAIEQAIARAPALRP
ncbi:MAG TPA: hypothetical protein VMH88_03565 [Gemmatimonadales bacterium]|nr:hypothetical protein [Gemmatimonadales bacterium]